MSHNNLNVNISENLLFDNIPNIDIDSDTDLPELISIGANLINDEIFELDTFINTDNIQNSNKSSYEKVLDIIGLNININYPDNIIINGIIDMHMIIKPSINPNSISYNSKYSKIYIFRNDKYSKKLEYILFDQNGGYTSFANIARNYKRISRNYRYNKVVNKIDKTVVQNTLGFNYSNPRWNNLLSDVIE